MLDNDHENSCRRWGKSTVATRKWERQLWMEGSLGMKESNVWFSRIRFERGWGREWESKWQEFKIFDSWQGLKNFQGQDCLFIWVGGVNWGGFFGQMSIIYLVWNTKSEAKLVLLKHVILSCDEEVQYALGLSGWQIFKALITIYLRNNHWYHFIYLHMYTF